MINAILCLSLFLVPLIFAPNIGDGIRFPKEAASIFFLIIIIITAIRSGPMRSFRGGWLLLFLAWSWVVTILNPVEVPIYLEKVIVDMPALFLAWKELFYITIAIMAIYAVSSHSSCSMRFLHTPFAKIEFPGNIFAPLSKCVAMSVTIVGAYAILQAVGLDEIFRNADLSTGFVASNPLLHNANEGAISRRIVGTLGNPTLLGVWLAMCMPLCFSAGKKIAVVSSVIGIAAIALSASSSAILGLAVSVGVYTLFKNKKVFFILCAVSVLLSATVISNMGNCKVASFFNPTGRVEVHREAWKILIEKPSTGLGLGTFEYLVGGNPQIAKRLHDQNWRELHDEYGQLWFSTGFIGLSIFLCFVFSCAVRAMRTKSMEAKIVFSSLASFLATSFFQFNFRVAPVSFYGVILTGVFLKLLED